MHVRLLSKAFFSESDAELLHVIFASRLRQSLKFTHSFHNDEKQFPVESLY